MTYPVFLDPEEWKYVKNMEKYASCESTIIMLIIWNGPLCYVYRNYQSPNWPILNVSPYLCMPL